MGPALSAARIGLKRSLKTVLGLPGLFLGRKEPCLRVLFYHRINPYPSEGLGPVSREITVRPEEFAWQMEYLAGHGFHVVNFEEFEELRAKRKQLQQNCVLITFDDGYEDNLLYAAPVLKKHGFPALVFVVADFIGKQSADILPYADERQYGRFLSQEQIGELMTVGIDIGSHTLSHPLLTSLDAARLQQEITGSRERLEQMFGTAVKSFAYPGGDFDQRVEQSVARAGYSAAFTTLTGATPIDEPMTTLSRTEVSASDSKLVFRMKLRGSLDWLAVKDRGPIRRLLAASNRILMPLAKGTS
ncbi:peptidoglycan/xylan/chitin deacetylase (PgdA/CDA1 family) [Pararhizobium capsulatum DSM 1112]|uniref:Chitooligosaccharide deacetylase n=1 Tax=Pararhizobium capsulatum DSM 1112 TaxID=1121113 RepID=A0ABU0BS64_9HYPH|nr:polysaccharide deacetylase family protein [Pararhizobium capsulatum]MDQ0321102.1 peptidoglycan/xylan/chitin deacetylase (PgdA/CDA1 family) [Pararhizobium capsulatum DSM 1112]